jgi:alkanesulfonate monooxygenase
MPIEFLGMAATDDSSETRARFTSGIDQGHAQRLAQAYEGTGRGRLPLGHSKVTLDGVQPAACTGRRLAHRLGVTVPSHATRTPAILDRPGNGQRHLISIVRGEVAPRDRGRDTPVFVR